MTPFTLIWIGLGGLLSLGLLGSAYWLALRKRRMDIWLRSYYFHSQEKTAALDEEKPLDVFIAVCDHYEPEWGRPSLETSIARVQRWVDDYPRLFGEFRDSSNRPPLHTYFFPQDEYRPIYLDMLHELVVNGWGDVDVHLHHDHDTEETLREKLESFKETLFHRHGLLRRDPQTNEIVYGFIHGNWALCNSRPDGRWCGVDQELSVLQQSGCYADFTLPSAPSNTQTQIINRIYYAQDIPGQCKSHNRGILARVGMTPPKDHLLMIQGALVPDWKNRKLGVFPRIENSDLHAGRPPAWKRFQDWIRAGIHVQGKPDWLFVKLHTHGCKDGNIDTLLGPETQQFHRDLANYARQHSNFHYHYVTAWEMAQLVHQAELGRHTPDLIPLGHTQLA